MPKTLTFPEGFLWAAAASSYQIEGAVDEDGRGPSVWDTFSATPGKVRNGDTGAVACDHYHRYADDVSLMKSLGLQAYRFSIAWPRIIPQGTGAVNAAGLDFYDRLVDELLKNEIQPWATLYHWDLPQPLEDMGGWPDRRVVDAFVHYADVTSKRLGDRVKHWMTFNEPWVFAFLGYGNGIHAPGRTDFSDYLKAAHHLLVAHGRSVPVIRANGDDKTQVGIVFNLGWADPATDSDEDKAAVHRFDGFMNRWYLDPVYKGEYPADMVEAFSAMVPEMPDIHEGDMQTIQGKPDFLGINFYTRQVIRHAPENTDGLKFASVRQEGEHTAMDWEVSPQSIYNIIKYAHEHYHDGPIYITENGAAFEDVLSADGETLDDPRRVAFYREYLANCHRAIQDGHPLKGYFAWSLMDNFEWAEGYEKRFGIVYVDFDTQKRTLKNSAKWYRQAIQNNGFAVE